MNFWFIPLYKEDLKWLLLSRITMAYKLEDGE
jgi:hypothetical protein